jgi:acetyltransferase-like isoleucine patch superfamily enzyme
VKAVADGSGSGRAGAFVDPGARVSPYVSLAPGAVIHEGVVIGTGSSVGSAAVIHAGTEIGARCVIEDGAVVGKRPRLRAGSRGAGDELPALTVADDVTICAGAVIYAGARIEAGVIVGDQAQVRERTVIGAGSVVGRGSAIEFDAILGKRVLIQSDVYVTARSVVEDDVFLGPGVTTTNDDTMGRHPSGSALAGPTFRRACRVGGGAVLVPGVVIGEEAFVAAGSVVTRDVGGREVVMGVPARVVRQVTDEDLIERWR